MEGLCDCFQCIQALSRTSTAPHKRPSMDSVFWILQATAIFVHLARNFRSWTLSPQRPPFTVLSIPFAFVIYDCLLLCVRSVWAMSRGAPAPQFSSQPAKKNFRMCHRHLQRPKTLSELAGPSHFPIVYHKSAWIETDWASKRKASSSHCRIADRIFFGIRFRSASSCTTSAKPKFSLWSFWGTEDFTSCSTKLHLFNTSSRSSSVTFSSPFTSRKSKRSGDRICATVRASALRTRSWICSQDAMTSGVKRIRNMNSRKNVLGHGRSNCHVTDAPGPSVAEVWWMKPGPKKMASPVALGSATWRFVVVLVPKKEHWRLQAPQPLESNIRH